ncbi:UTP--glucose-1-phosphate uridylyltransferase, partial [Afipia felis]
LEDTLEERQKKKELAILERDQPEAGTTSFTRQQQPLGLGHAVWCAREIVGNEPFAVLLPDVLVKNKPSGLKQMIDAANAAGADKANIIAVEEVPMEHVHMYGVVGVGPSKGDLFELNGMVEKPKKEVAPSNLSITGRYILQPEIFNILETQERGAGGEIQLTDAMLTLAGRQPFYGFKFKGKSYDCGSKSGFLAANIAYAMDREDLRGDLLSEMKKYV